MTDQVKIVGDVLSASVVLATLADWLPPVAAAMSIIWLSMQIWDWIARKLDTNKRRAWRRK